MAKKLWLNCAASTSPPGCCKFCPLSLVPFDPMRFAQASPTRRLRQRAGNAYDFAQGSGQALSFVPFGRLRAGFVLCHLTVVAQLHKSRSVMINLNDAVPLPKDKRTCGQRTNDKSPLHHIILGPNQISCPN